MNKKAHFAAVQKAGDAHLMLFVINAFHLPDFK